MAIWALIFITLVASTSGFRFVCYYSNKAQYRYDIGVFKPERIDPFLCTHLVYSYAEVVGLSIHPSQWNDKTTPWFKGMYEGFTKLKETNPQLKILLAIGSGDDRAQGSSFSQAISNDNSQNAFARNVASYIRSIKFDGGNLEWGNLAPALQKEFKTDLQQDNKALILAATLSANKAQIDTAYDIKLLSEELDFISIPTLDMRTAEDKKVGLSAPLYSSPNATGTDTYLSVKWVADYYVSRGVNRDKMNIGIPTYGRTFQLRSENQTSIGSDAIDHGHPGPRTNSIGIIGYFDMCNSIRDAGRVTNVPAQHGRYYVNDTQWVSYEDILSVLEKTCYVSTERFGGITFWTLDLDDFIGVGCHHNNFPLITTAVNVMKDTNSSLCTTRLSPLTFVSVPAAPSQSTTTPAPVQQTVGGRRVVCYFTSWAQYRGGKGRFLPENIDPHLCTHIIYLSANVRRDGTIATFADNEDSEPWREGLYARVVKLKKDNPHLKVLLSIGGATADYGAFEAIITANDKRDIFVKNVVSYLRERGFDGMELSWHQPQDMHLLPRYNLLVNLKYTFVAEARTSGNARLLLTLGILAGKERLDSGYGFHLNYILNYVDFFNLLNYNFHVSWMYTALNSPLFTDPNDRGEYNVGWVGRYYMNWWVPTDRINIGIPTFAITYTLRESRNNSLGSRVNGTGKPGNYTERSGYLAYYEVCDFIASGAEVVTSPDHRVIYAVKGDQWVSFESPESATEKACYAMKNELGGVNVWSLDYDDFNGDSCGKGVNPLMATISKIVQHNDQERRCIGSLNLRASSGGSDGNILGKNLLNVHLLLAWLLVIVCVV